MVPVCVPGQFAVYYDVFARKVVLLPGAVRAGNRQPSGISGTASVVPVNEEVTMVQSCDREHILRLGLSVSPGAVNQSGEREPVQLV